MTKKLLYLLGMLITILVGTYFYITCCSSCGNTIVEAPEKKIIAPVKLEATSYPFSFNGEDFTFNTNDNFNFNASTFTVLEPLSGEIGQGINSLKDYFSKNPSNVLDIIGLYKNSETNNSAFPNLGIARANAVKNYMVSKGIASKQLNTSGKLQDDMVPKDNVYLGPIKYNISIEVDNTDEMAVLYEKIKANPLVLYFNTGKASINLSAKQRQKVADISRYLDKTDNAICSIVGHTDNTGSRTINIGLGQSRADFAKKYFVENGISDTKIKTSSKGPDVPVSTSNTEEGKSKNRRTVVTIK